VGTAADLLLEDARAPHTVSKSRIGSRRTDLPLLKKNQSQNFLPALPFPRLLGQTLFDAVTNLLVSLEPTLHETTSTLQRPRTLHHKTALVTGSLGRATTLPIVTAVHRVTAATYGQLHLFAPLPELKALQVTSTPAMVCHEAMYRHQVLSPAARTAVLPAVARFKVLARKLPLLLHRHEQRSLHRRLP